MRRYEHEVSKVISYAGEEDTRSLAHEHQELAPSATGLEQNALQSCHGIEADVTRLDIIERADFEFRHQAAT